MELQRDYNIGFSGAVRLLYSRLFRTRWDVIYVTLLVLCGGFVYSQHLERTVAVNDETFYMAAAQFSVKNGYWLVPHVTYEAWTPGIEVGVQPFLIKPPLAIWFQMLSMELLGTSATAGRLPAVLFSLLTAVCVYYLGRIIYSRKTGFIAAVAFLTTRLIFRTYHGGRSGALDVPMLFFGTLAVGAVFLGIRRGYPRKIVFPVAGIALAAAILTKGFGAGVFAVIVLPLLIVHWRAVLTWEGTLAAGLAAAIPLAWFAVAGLFYGNVLGDMLYEQVISRVSGSLATTPATFGFMNYPYFRHAPSIFDPWWYLFFAALVTVPLGIYRRRGHSRLGTDTLFLCWWALSVFGFFVITGNHPWYLMPMVIPVGLICGRLIDRGLRPSPEAAGLAIGLSLTLMNSPLVGRAIRSLSRGTLPSTPPVRFVLVVGCLGMLITVVYRKQWLPTIRPQIDLTRAARVTKQAFTVSLIVLVLLQLPMADVAGADTADQKQLGERVHAMTPSDATLYLYPKTQGPIHTFMFYADRSLREATLEQLNTDRAIKYALVERSVPAKLRRPHERIGTMDTWKTELVLVKFNEARSATNAPSR